jgi:putative endonuclease
MREYDFYVYIVECADGSYYTGITNNFERRIAEHNAGLDHGSYTFSRRPVVLAHVAHFSDVWEAIAWEKHVKRWSRAKKKALIKKDEKALRALARCLNASRHGIFAEIKTIRKTTKSFLHISGCLPRLRSE